MLSSGGEGGLGREEAYVVVGPGTRKLVIMCMAAVNGIDVIKQRLNITLTPSSLSDCDYSKIVRMSLHCSISTQRRTTDTVHR